MISIKFIVKYVFYIRQITILVILSLTFLFPKISYAQINSSQEIKQLQRSIFIFNFAQQVGWNDFDALETFKIGVLGPDRTALDLTQMAKKRKILGKDVEVIRFQSIQNIKDVQLLYVNFKYNYEIAYVLRKTAGKQILIVSEDYKYNTSMINILNVGDSFEYEINTARLEKEGFRVAPSLKQYAITSSHKWKELYKSTEKSLEKTKEENKEKRKVIVANKEQIKKQEEKILNQKKSIDQKVGEISGLWTEASISKKKYEEKLVIEQELEKSIQEQLEFIKEQEEKIQKSTVEIDRQLEYLKQQDQEISIKKKKLAKQNIEINRQKRINLLLVLLVSAILLGSFFIFRGYLFKKKVNAKLKQNNIEIRGQAQELIAKNKELEQFAYIASHDLQEPLNTITSFIGLISEDYGSSFDDVGKESLTFITGAANRMKKLIDALLEYSRLGRSENRSIVDLNTVVKELKADLNSVLERTQTKINIDDLPTVKGSDVELRLLLQNLISNGIKFTDKTTIPEINISVSDHKNEEESFPESWEFAVKDNGIGIPEIHKERIFSIFQRLHSREKYEGTGIGLAHCKKIVEAHGGAIWLASEEGVGTTFYFTIPK